MELLVISHTAPLAKTGLAGEKTHNYYLKAFAGQKDFNVRLITACKATDLDKLDLTECGIKNCVFVESQSKAASVKRKLLRAISLIFNPDDKYANFVSRERQRFFFKSLKQWKADGYKPDCIILEFTHSILLIDKVREIFPQIPVIGSSHDVNFKGSERLYKFEQNKLVKFFRKRQFQNLKFREVQALAGCDYIVTQNNNDIAILREQDLLKNKRFMRIVPYYDSYADIKRLPDERTIIFYGSMGRKENYLSIIKFIEEVFLKLENNARLVIIGGNPPEALKKYESENIHITGFLPLEKVKNYFATCDCMVVPLLLGSGIKVKILEAFSGGIPVITNDIGNEGIFAQNGKEIILCNGSEEFITFFLKKRDRDVLNQIGLNGQKYVFEIFNLEESRQKYIDLVKLAADSSKK